MTPIQVLEIRAGEIRKRLGDIGAMTELSDETRSELDKLKLEYADNDSRRAALVISEDAPVTHIETRSAEGREFRSLVNGANVGHIFDAALQKRSVDGATKELQDHYGLDQNQVPLALLVKSWPDNDELETRAVTPAPANVGQQQQSIVPFVFPQSVGVFLGVTMPTVGVGEQVYPVLTSTLSVKTPDEGIDADETTGAFSADVLSPARLQAAFFYSREDRARFAGMDAALRENLSMGLSDGLDKEILTGDNGLLHSTNLANHNVTTETTYPLYRSQFAYDRVDGRYASTTGDLRVVMGAETYAHAAGQYRGNNDNMDALMSLMNAVGGVRVSAHVPAVASTKQNAVIRRGMNMAMVAPVWEGVTILEDQITQAKKGWVIITAIMLHQIKILRTDDWYKQQVQTS